MLRPGHNENDLIDIAKMAQFVAFACETVSEFVLPPAVLGETKRMKKLDARLELYRNKKPYREE
jgi:hypothetical protein